MGNKSRSGRAHSPEQVPPTPSDRPASPEEAREHPKRITHGFWFRQYSWLHAADCQRLAAEGSEELAASPRSQRKAPASASRLLSKWTNSLVRNLGGGSTGELVGQRLEEREVSSGSRSAPAVHASEPSGPRIPKSVHRDGSEADRAGARHRSLNWLLKSVSRSTSTLMGAREEHQGRQQQQRRRQQQQQVALDLDGEEPATARLALPTTPRRSSPYRQLVCILRPRHQEEEEEEEDHGVAEAHKEQPAVKGDGKRQVEPSSRWSRKKKRQENVAGGSGRARRQQQQPLPPAGSLLGHLLLVSPRFRRKAPRRPAELIGDDKRTGGEIRQGPEVGASGGLVGLDRRQAGRPRAAPPGGGLAQSSLSEFKLSSSRDRAGKNYANEPDSGRESPPIGKQQTDSARMGPSSRRGKRRRQLEGTAEGRGVGPSGDRGVGFAEPLEWPTGEEPRSDLGPEPGGLQLTSAQSKADSSRRPAAAGDGDGAAAGSGTGAGSGTRPEMGREDGNIGGAAGWPGKKAPPVPPPRLVRASACTGVDRGASEGKAALAPLIQPLASSPSSSPSSSSNSSSSSVRSSSNSAGASPGRLSATLSTSASASASASPSASSPSSSEASSSLALAAAATAAAADGSPLSCFERPDCLQVAFEAGSSPGERKRPASQPGQPPPPPSATATSGPTTTGGTSPKAAQMTPTTASSSFKKLVKRQQSVDSYRMARDLKNKLRRQQEGHRGKHQSNEAIKTRSVGDERPTGTRKYSMRALDDAERAAERMAGSGGECAGEQVAGGLRICVDHYARPGSFTLPSGEQQVAADEGPPTRPTKSLAGPSKGKAATSGRLAAAPTPPNTLSLMPSAGNLLMGSGFSGCITPTYPTHHLPSPKYVSPATLGAMEKKYSNASTISSSLGACESLATTTTTTTTNNNNHNHSSSGGRPSSATDSGTVQHVSNVGPASGEAPMATATNQSDTESSLGGSAATPSRPSFAAGQQATSGLGSMGVAEAVARAQEESAAAARRANLAEHIYDNKCGLGEDMKFLASLPELCDITFLVGETREPVCAVKSVLAARSRVFNKILFGNRQLRSRIGRQAPHEELEDVNSYRQVTGAAGEAHSAGEPSDRCGSSPRQLSRALVGVVKSSSPVSRSTSPNQQQQQWSVTSDPTGQAQVAHVEAEPAAGGRSVSVASNGRESVSQVSQGSQQPLIIGPGQMATPVKGRSKGKRTEGTQAAATSGHHHGRLSRMFLNSRASDPSIKQQHQQQQQLPALQTAPNGASNQSYLDKMVS